VLENLRCMPVSEEPVGLEILIHFDEMEIPARILAGAARADLQIADDAGVRGDQPASVRGRRARISRWWHSNRDWRPIGRLLSWVE